MSLPVFVEPGPRTAGRLVSLELTEPLRPRWMKGHSVPLWLAREAPATSPSGEVLARVVDEERAWPAIVRSDRGVTFAFDPDEAVAAFQDEAYFEPARPLHTYASLPYQYVPGELRLRIFRWLVKPHAPAPGFPLWPHDSSTDVLRWACARACHLDRPETARPLWPHGKRYVLTISHDVDTAEGVRHIRDVAAFEDGLGVRSCWYVVGDLFDVDPSALQALQDAGHEVGLHGDVHDNTIAYRSPDQIERRLARCSGVIERHRIRGFRSPSLLETPALRRALQPRFTYASQVPDTEVHSLVGPRRGCATSFPFLRHGLLEIPITLPMEDKLIMQGMDESDILALWRAKAAAVRDVGGIVQLAIHNEPHLLRRCRRAYEPLVRELSADPSVWVATTVEIAEWWTAARGDGNA